MSAVYRIELETFEAIVPGGVRRVTWLVERDGDWLVAGEMPGASVEQRDVGPGTVWLRRVLLELPPGSRLARVESVPDRTPARDPLAYLFGSAGKRARRTRRSHFIVNGAGKLERVPTRRA